MGLDHMGIYLYDVIIIGAGPGGNISALRLASMGYKVVLLDWRKTVGDKLCTGIVGKECVEKFPPNGYPNIHEKSYTWLPGKMLACFLRQRCR